MAMGIKLLYMAGFLTVLGTMGGLVSTIVAPPPPVATRIVGASSPAVATVPGAPLPVGNPGTAAGTPAVTANNAPKVLQPGSPAPAQAQTQAQAQVQQATPQPAQQAKPELLARPGLQGTILRETWNGIPGSEISNLTSSLDYPASPSETEFMRAFETAENTGDEYGEVYRGYIHPTLNGEYTFWISSDDAGELWLSPSENPKEIKRIANVNGFTEFRKWDSQPNQKSPPIKMEAGKRYYIEARHKEGSGGDHLSVGWQMPDGAQERPIPGYRLSPATPYPRKPIVLPTAKLSGPIPTTPGQHKMRAQISIGGQPKWDMAYLIELPVKYKPTGEPWPLYTFLHGNTHQGNDHNGLLNEGPAQYLNQMPKLREQMPLITFIPQCPAGERWDNDQVIRANIAILDEVIKAYNVDKLRVYCTGLSMGGMGTWRMALEAPDRFAAITTLSAVAVKPEKAAVLLKDTPMRIYCGAVDGGFTEGSKYMYQVMKAAGADVELTVVPNEGHGSWAHFYPDINFYLWFLKHKRKP